MPGVLAHPHRLGRGAGQQAPLRGPRSACQERLPEHQESGMRMFPNPYPMIPYARTAWDAAQAGRHRCTAPGVHAKSACQSIRNQG